MKRLLLTFMTLTSTMMLWAQDDLLSMLEEESNNLPNIIEATFKGTRLINGHSIETRNEGTLEFIISHRFGTLNSGGYNLWGLDQSNIRLALEYSILDQLMIGLGRNSYEKTYDGFVKYKLMKQQTGAKNIPVSMVWLSSMSLETQDRIDDYVPSFTQKLATNHQLLIARKMTPAVSVQLMPTFIHYNLQESYESSGNVLALGVGGRVKLNQRVTLNAEYYYQVQDKWSEYYDALAIGVDIETGGHVFQLQFTNAQAMIEKGFVGETKGNFFDGDIHFGFNITRAFQLK
jgi:hypothetical protein